MTRGTGVHRAPKKEERKTIRTRCKEDGPRYEYRPLCLVPVSVRNGNFSGKIVTSLLSSPGTASHTRYKESLFHRIPPLSVSVVNSSVPLTLPLGLQSLHFGSHTPSPTEHPKQDQ